MKSGEKSETKSGDSKSGEERVTRRLREHIPFSVTGTGDKSFKTRQLLSFEKRHSFSGKLAELQRVLVSGRWAR